MIAGAHEQRLASRIEPNFAEMATPIDLLGGELRRPLFVSTWQVATFRRLEQQTRDLPVLASFMRAT
jgi:hypothetical protein